MPEVGLPGESGLTALVSGRVQGVGFRWFVRQRARRLGVSGWVANLADGRVQVAARGSPAALQELTAALHRGPPGSRVDQVTVGPIESAQTLPDPFQIR